MGKGKRRGNIRPIYPGVIMAGGGSEPIVSCPETGAVKAEFTSDPLIEVDGVLMVRDDMVVLVGMTGEVLAKAVDPTLLDCIERGFGYSGTIRRNDDGSVRIEFWQAPRS
jgi:hypothetical protein